MKHDPLNDSISMLKQYERLGRSECVLKPTSKILINVLQVFQKAGYINEFEVEDNEQGGYVRVRLIKNINDCGVIKPRFPVKNREFIKWEKRYLPSRGFGVIVVSTPQGVMSHSDAKEKGLGGRLIAYVY
ncbi:MAG: 30S ribosomal protein S8 [Candidatus Altiarchaeota archaeon]